MTPLLIPVLGNLLDRIFPDPKAAAEGKLELMRMAQAGELAQLDAEVKLITGQIDVNKVEAASQSLFVAGWRPAIGWVCGAAFAFKFILGPAAVVVMAMAGHPITLPEFDFTEMSTILMGMLGLGALRTVEKVKGVP
ncbi:holin family protein [Massilia sp. YIM B02769]|uniref:holin family protein n=1 Tax=Massilia sp. YIM B02769 TaxID=3050129 RepID=UPI0025B72A95|nr:holin family protein [Massilia sp. YIM B02769]MDN4061662.1 holin family protein [Massilia sp. YIM B02769]